MCTNAHARDRNGRMMKRRMVGRRPRNGQPPSAREEWRQHEALDNLKRETPDQRTERVRQQEEETALLVREVPQAFDFQLAGQDIINGRPAYQGIAWR